MPDCYNVEQIKPMAEKTWGRYLSFLEWKQKTQDELSQILCIEYPEHLIIDVDPIYDLHVTLILDSFRGKFHWDSFIGLVERTEKGKKPDWSVLRPINE